MPGYLQIRWIVLGTFSDFLTESSAWLILLQPIQQGHHRGKQRGIYSNKWLKATGYVTSIDSLTRRLHHFAARQQQSLSYQLRWKLKAFCNHKTWNLSFSVLLQVAWSPSIWYFVVLRPLSPKGPRLMVLRYLLFVTCTVGLRALGQHAEVKQATRSALAPEIDSKHGLVPSEELSETTIGMKKRGHDKGVKKGEQTGNQLLWSSKSSWYMSLRIHVWYRSKLAEAFVRNQPCALSIAITCWKPWPWDSVGSTLHVDL